MKKTTNLARISYLSHSLSPNILYGLSYPKQGVFHPDHFILDGWVCGIKLAIEKVEIVSLVTGERLVVTDVDQRRPDVFEAVAKPITIDGDRLGFYQVIDVAHSLQAKSQYFVINALHRDSSGINLKFELAKFSIQTYPANLTELEPDFIIAGSMKSGTTALYSYLCEHPQVMKRDPKEIHYFTFQRERGDAWYRSFFYKQPGCLVGESSPSYFDFSIQHPEIASQIKAEFPNTKIIVVLRNPTDRAISHLYHDKHRLGITELDINIFNVDNLADYTNIPYLADYITGGLYLEKLKLWQSFFSVNSLLVLDNTELLENTASTMEKVLAFLNLDLDNFTIQDFKPVYQNHYPTAPSEVIQALDEFYLADNQEIKALTGIDFMKSRERCAKLGAH